MNNMKVSDTWFIESCRERPSKHGGYIWHIDLKNVGTQERAKTYADPGNQNWRHWEETVTCAKNKGVIISGLRQKKKGLINADSQPNILVVDDKDKLTIELNELWSKPNLGPLFGE